MIWRAVGQVRALLRMLLDQESKSCCSVKIGFALKPGTAVGHVKCHTCA